MLLPKTSAMNWLNCFACKQKTVENVKTLDFSRTSLTEVPADVFNFERTLETLYIDGNKVSVSRYSATCLDWRLISDCRTT